MSEFAIIETGGKQYKVAPGQKIKIERLAAQENSAVTFDKVLLVNKGDDARIGTPYVSGASVEAKLLKNGRSRKIIVFKYKSKVRYRKTRGHRQHYSEIEITRI